MLGLAGEPGSIAEQGFRGPPGPKEQIERKKREVGVVLLGFLMITSFIG